MGDIEVTGYRRFVRNTMKGFISVRIISLDLKILDLTLHERDSERWIMLPGKPELDRHRNLVKDDDGKIQYESVLRFGCRQSHEAFQSAVLDALDRRQRT